MYIVLSVLFAGIMLVLFFVLGALFCRHIMVEAQENAKHEMLKYEFCRLADARTPSDPQPYVPPVAPRANGILPGMRELDKLLRKGKRGTVMLRAGDRYKSAGQSTTN